MEFQINFQMAISADYPSQAPANSDPCFLFTRGLSELLTTANPQEGTFLSVDSAPIEELALSNSSHFSNPFPLPDV